MIVEQIQIGGFAVFCYVLGDPDTGEGIVVDPGGPAAPILDQARKSGINAIKLIVNTHCHVDHTLGNGEMQQATGAPIAIHEADAPALASPNSAMLQMFAAEASPPATRILKDGDILTFGNQSVEVIHTPGHTPGGICLYFSGYVITGDTLFVQGVGRTDFPGGSYEALQASIKNRLFTLPPETVVLPGHRYGPTPTSTIGREIADNVYV